MSWFHFGCKATGVKIVDREGRTQEMAVATGDGISITCSCHQWGCLLGPRKSPDEFGRRAEARRIWLTHVDTRELAGPVLGQQTFRFRD